MPASLEKRLENSSKRQTKRTRNYSASYLEEGKALRMSKDSSELHDLMKRAEVEGPLMPREDRKRLEFLIQQLMPDRY